MKPFVFFWILVSYNNIVFSQQGCTDPLATNYNPAATVNDGSCQYSLTTRQLFNKVSLPASLNETSGLIYHNDKLYTMNDGGDQAAFYQLNESTGAVIQTIRITNATNTDWEAITADDDFIYIGDFGNNSNGNRSDLRVYRVSSELIGEGPVIELEADIISFTYEDQVIEDPILTGPNNTVFDCEAFIAKNGQLHLFSKDWISDRSKQYSMPALPGVQIAKPVDSFYVNGLITDASIAPDGLIVLTGYTRSFTDAFLWLLYDYSGDKFFTGNKRQVQIGKIVDIANRSQDRGQVEGIAFTSNGKGYISNERIQREVFGFTVIVQPMLHSFSVSDLVSLPARLSAFSLSTVQNSIVLNWTSLEESSLHYYSVERSDESSHFNEIAKVIAGNKPAGYRYRDYHPVEGNNFYRLRIVNIDGTASYSLIRNISYSNNNNTKLIATIAAGNIINFTNVQEGLSYRIFSGNGTMVLKGSMNSSGKIDINSLTNGLYIIAMENQPARRFIKP